MRSISGSRMPRVVTAGLPRRMPPPVIGGVGSKGIEFLLTVMPARSSDGLRVLAGEAARIEIDQQQVIVRAAGDDAEAAPRDSRGQRFARWRTT